MDVGASCRGRLPIYVYEATTVQREDPRSHPRAAGASHSARYDGTGAMMPVMELAADEVADLVEQFWSLGGESVDLGLGRLVRSPAAPGHPLGELPHLAQSRLRRSARLPPGRRRNDHRRAVPTGPDLAADSTDRRSTTRAQRLVARHTTSARAPGVGHRRPSGLDVGNRPGRRGLAGHRGTVQDRPHRGRPPSPACRTTRLGDPRGGTPPTESRTGHLLRRAALV